MSTDTTPSTDEATDDERKAPPVFRQQFGRVTLSIWERHTKDGKRIFHEYSLQRSYRDDEQNWKNAYSFGTDDTGDVQLAVFTFQRWVRTEGKKRAVEFAQQHGNGDASDYTAF
jgi:hypothetical protein